MGLYYIGEETVDGADIVVAGGSVDFDAAPHLKEAVVGRIEAGSRHLVVDLGPADFIDSTAIGVLVGALKRLRETGGSLAVVCTDENVRNIFEIVGLEDVIPLHRTRDDAVSALAGAA